MYLVKYLVPSWQNLGKIPVTLPLLITSGRYLYLPTFSETKACDLGCGPLRWSGSGSLIQDHSDHAASKKPMNPCPEWIRRFLWCFMIRVILDQWSGSGPSQRNAPMVLVPAVFQSFYCNWTLYKTETSLRRTTVNGKLEKCFFYFTQCPS